VASELLESITTTQSSAKQTDSRQRRIPRSSLHAMMQQLSGSLSESDPSGAR
jgi:hypothetical protein